MDFIKILLLCILGKKNDFNLSFSSHKYKLWINCADSDITLKHFIYHIYRTLKKIEKQKIELLRNVQRAVCFRMLLHDDDLIRLGAILKIEIFPWLHAYLLGYILLLCQYFAYYLCQFQKYFSCFREIFKFNQTLF